MPAGETEQSPSAWTIDSAMQFLLDKIEVLRVWVSEHFGAHERAVDVALAAHEKMLVEMDKRYEQRFQAQEQATSLALARVDKEFHEHISQVRTETRAALEAADKAIFKSEAATEKRFESVNEFRAQLADQASRFMPRTESIQRHDSTAEKISDLDLRQRQDIAQVNSRLDLSTGAGAGADKYRTTLFALLAAAATIVGLAFALFGRN